MIRQHSKPAQSLLQYTNAFLEEPSQSQTLELRPGGEAPSPVHSSPLAELSRGSLVKKRADEDEALKELRQRLLEE